MLRLCVFLLLLLPVVSSLRFRLPVNSAKCLREHVDKHVLVTGEYEVSEEPETATSFQVRERVAPGTYGLFVLGEQRLPFVFHV